MPDTINGLIQLEFTVTSVIFFSLSLRAEQLTFVNCSFCIELIINFRSYFSSTPYTFNLSIQLKVLPPILKSTYAWCSFLVSLFLQNESFIKIIIIST